MYNAYVLHSVLFIAFDFRIEIKKKALLYTYAQTGGYTVSNATVYAVDR